MNHPSVKPMVISLTNALEASTPYYIALKYKWKVFTFSHLYQQTPEKILQREEQLNNNNRMLFREKRHKTEMGRVN